METIRPIRKFKRKIDPNVGPRDCAFWNHIYILWEEDDYGRCVMICDDGDIESLCHLDDFYEVTQKQCPICLHIK